MHLEKPKIRRNLFEIENARNMTRDEVVNTFVPPKLFWRLLSPKHHVLLGSRGSGKTAVARMLSHDHLSKLTKFPNAKRLIRSKAIIGMYIPTRLEWVGALTNKPWLSLKQQEEFFQWRFNLSTCRALVTALQSCIETFISDKYERAHTERKIATELSANWLNDSCILFNLFDLKEYLDTTEFKKQMQFARVQSLGDVQEANSSSNDCFGIDILSPLKRGIKLASRQLDIPEETAWLLCVDEVEFLESYHLKILNSLMRAHTDNLFFKITTMPYMHDKTTNTQVPLEEGHDFEYLFLDHDPIFRRRIPKESSSYGTWFARALFKRRVKESDNRHAQVTIDEFLGKSILLDPSKEDWCDNSKNWDLMKRYSTRKTIDRADRLYKDNLGHFMDQIGRKIHGALLLRSAIEGLKGTERLSIYSGATMVNRCGDCNPRRLIRIFNAMLYIANPKTGRKKSKARYPIDSTLQTRELIRLSDQTLAAVQSEPIRGLRLHALITRIGEVLKSMLYDQKLSTDQATSIEIDEFISDKDWELIKYAVAIGLLSPNIKHGRPNDLPVRNGSFHLGFILAPHFRLLPRRGKAIKLSLFWPEPKLFETFHNGE